MQHNKTQQSDSITVVDNIITANVPVTSNLTFVIISRHPHPVYHVSLILILEVSVCR